MANAFEFIGDSERPRRMNSVNRIEPWFYGYLTIISYVVLFLSILIFLGWIVLFALWVAHSSDNINAKWKEYFSIPFILGSFLGVLSTAFWAGCVLLFVDIGRSLRRIG